MEALLEEFWALMSDLYWPIAPLALPLAEPTMSWDQRYPCEMPFDGRDFGTQVWSDTPVWPDPSPPPVVVPPPEPTPPPLLLEGGAQVSTVYNFVFEDPQNEESSSPPQRKASPPKSSSKKREREESEEEEDNRPRKRPPSQPVFPSQTDTGGTFGVFQVGYVGLEIHPTVDYTASGRMPETTRMATGETGEGMIRGHCFYHYPGSDFINFE